MKILSIGTDRKLFEEGSTVRARVIEYGTLFDELDIIVFAKKNSQSISKVQISKNVFVYPTNSLSRWFYIWDAFRLGKSIIGNWDLGIGNCVITCQDPFECGLVGWLIARKFHLPLQLQVHTDFLSPFFRRSSFLNRARVCLAKFILPRADGIRVVSNRIKQSVLKVPSSKLQASRITVLPIFVDVRKIKNMPISPEADLRKKYPQFEFIVLMASRLSPEKNIGLAISAWREIVKKFPKAGLVIVGSGPLLNSLRLQVTRYKLHANLVFEPWRDDLISYYKTADCFVCASLYEGFGLSIAEAAAAGCPIVASDVGLVGGVLKSGEHLDVCPVGDKDCFVKRLSELLADLRKRESYSAKALRAVEDRLPKSKDEYLKSYKESFERCLI